MQLFGTDKKSIFIRKPKLLYIGAYRPNPGWMRSLHTHNFCELMFVKEGNGLIRIRETDHQFIRGDLIALNPNVPHTELIFDAPERDIIFLGITRLNLDGYEKNSLVKNADYCIAHTGEFYETLRNYFEQLTAENEMKPDYFTLVSDSLLAIIISYTLRLTSPEANKLFESKKNYNEVKEYIDRYYTTIDTIDDVCKDLYINRFYLTHLFKDSIGIPPLKYLIQKRIEHAKSLLETTDKSIGIIAKECGYLDTAYFCRVFKKVTSVTPKAYRDKIKSTNKN